MKEYVEKVKSQKDLEQREIEDVMKVIMSGEGDPSEIADFLLSLNAKGPSISEITGAAEFLRKCLVEVKADDDIVLDTCGTGGDKKNTFNISTISAFIVAGSGIKVAKHGNRSVSSKCGSADILEALGVNITVDANQLSECMGKAGIAFLFAQKLHPAMKHVAPIRKSLGVETIFNILGPLINPAKATHQMMGVYKKDFVEPLAHVLKNLGLKKAMVVHGQDGLDEVTTTGKTWVSEYNGVDVVSYEIDPMDYGIPLAQESDLKGGNLEMNIGIVNDILDGKAGPKRDIVTLNAGCALYIAEKVSDIKGGIALANDIIDSGKAREKLEALKAFTN